MRARESRPRSSTQIDGLPRAVCRFLDRLDRPDLRSQAISRHLDHWREISDSPRELLIQTFDNPSEQRPRWMDDARRSLEAAIVVLPRHHSRHLAGLVAHIDRRVVERTNPDFCLPYDPEYACPPHPAWWTRRTAL